MDGKMENLRAGIAEMRSVAQKLEAWASDLEKNFLADGFACEACAAGPPVEAVVHAEPDKPADRAEVKAFLTSLCAKGYSAQVKALIASFGATSLSAVADGDLDELFNAALLLGSEEGGGADAG